MKEVTDAGELHDSRRRSERGSPLDHGPRRHDIVGGTVHQQPRAVRRDEARAEARNRRRNGHETAGCHARRNRQRYGAAEREPAEIQRQTRPSVAAVCDDGRSIVALADAIGVAALGVADAAEIEPDCYGAEICKRSSERGHDLVLHCAVVQRMRMANHRYRLDVATGFVERELESPRRAQGLGACRRHGAPRHLTPASADRSPGGRGRAHVGRRTRATPRRRPKRPGTPATT
jgi:hypothetical protein